MNREQSFLRGQMGFIGYNFIKRLTSGYGIEGVGYCISRKPYQK